MAADETLELAEAAKRLGVHPSTLRRWADAGVVSHTRTLSGRRRFSRQVIDHLCGTMGQPEAPVQAEQLEEQTLSLARQRSSHVTLSQAGWMEHLNEDQRLLFRYTGQRLLGLLLQFISRSSSADTFLEEGRRVAGDYGRVCYKAGLTVSQTAEAFLYFRRSIIEAVQGTARLGDQHDPDSSRIFLRTIDFFDALLVATIESYDQIRQAA